ncbi:unnamed protein product [Adineta steineri]|uniref:Uncharacterized protein n=1 Tax=Adineta steineri TaxID=433720 RepID=A0A813PUJ7_9BILA|nr:unnamed protein product [Adineta steineri]CAF0812950.1 unnamed protein product [Adineta steineri]CAF0899829.1 unnamed protein product [Adineta steineri]CAF3529291.1 unnamed protein product [Adineta steineri]CAF3757129.1 unnamed protein product [Adineta steineri]
MASSSSVTAPNSSENSDNISNQSSNINDEIISATEPPALFAIRSRRNVVCARPFEDVNMGSSDADTSSGTVTKPNDNKSSSTSKHA